MTMTLTLTDVLITAENVHKSFPLPEGKGEFNVLREINLTVKAGKCWRCWDAAAAERVHCSALWPG